MKAQNNFSSFTQDINLGNVISFKNLSVHPITVPVGYKKKYISLDEAIKKNLIKISEINEGGSVNYLKVLNQGKAYTYILYFNYLRKFRYKGYRSPIEILKTTK